MDFSLYMYDNYVKAHDGNISVGNKILQGKRGLQALSVIHFHLTLEGIIKIHLVIFVFIKSRRLLSKALIVYFFSIFLFTELFAT